jgi:glycerol-3-phosphate acyltransferase PlsY
MFGIIIVFVLSVVCAYLLGSIPSALIAGRLSKGIDIRQHGSKNAGATNTFRVLGWKIGAAVAAADLLKGAAAGILIRYMLLENFLLVGPELYDSLASVIEVCGAVAVIIGHIFPLFAGFRGGKGVAAGAGVLFALQPLVAAVSLAVFIAVALISGFVSLASICAAVVMPISYLVLKRCTVPDPVWFVFLICAAVIILTTHRKNISRLLKGEENRFKTPFRKG